MKIAIASSGLGHITRGIETWACDTAEALSRRGVAVTLFAARPVACAAPLVTIPCLRRGSLLNRCLVRAMPAATWRYGLKSAYALEQRTFWNRLRPRLEAGGFDLLHVQDPQLAHYARCAAGTGRPVPPVLLAHGTEEPTRFLEPFDYVQHLAPWHLEQARAQVTVDRPLWRAIPNFVATDRFRPVADAARQRALRRAAGLPETGCLLGTAAAIKRDHKRIDYLIREFAQAAERSDEPLHLVIAGARHPDLPGLEALADQHCPGRITFRPDYPHARMPELLQCLDLFVLTSLFEMMPIALLEALATGLPVITHRHPVLEWMTGPGGCCVDLAVPGGLAGAVTALDAGARRRLGAAARAHGVQQFSEDAVIPRYLDWYHEVTRADRGAPRGCASRRKTLWSRDES